MILVWNYHICCVPVILGVVMRHGCEEKTTPQTITTTNLGCLTEQKIQTKLSDVVLNLQIMTGRYLLLLLAVCFPYSDGCFVLNSC